MNISKNIFFLVVLITIILRLPYLLYSPPGQFPDEIFIYERIYVETLERISPDLLAGFSKYHSNNEFHYPPLYFFVNSLVLQFLFYLYKSILGLTSSFVIYFKIFRLESLFLSLLSGMLIWKIVDSLKTNKYIAIGTFLFAMLLPTVSVFSNALNFFPLSFIFTLFCLCIVSRVKNNKPTRKEIVILGIAVGFSQLVYIINILLIPTIVFYIFRSRVVNKPKFVIIFILLVFVCGGWWYVANYYKFGSYIDTNFSKANQLGNSHSKPFQTPKYFDFVVKHSWQSFIFTAGRTNNLRLSDNGYSIWTLLFFISVVGFVRKLKNNMKLFKDPIVYTMAVLFILNLTLFSLMNFVMGLAPQGRYFYTSIIFISLVFCLGISAWFDKKRLYLLPIFLFLFLLFFNFWGLGCFLKVYYRMVYIPMSLECINYGS